MILIGYNLGSKAEEKNNKTPNNEIGVVLDKTQSFESDRTVYLVAYKTNDGYIKTHYTESFSSYTSYEIGKRYVFKVEKGFGFSQMMVLFVCMGFIIFIIVASIFND